MLNSSVSISKYKVVDWTGQNLNKDVKRQWALSPSPLKTQASDFLSFSLYSQSLPLPVYKTLRVKWTAFQKQKQKKQVTTRGKKNENIEIKIIHCPSPDILLYMTAAYVSESKYCFQTGPSNLSIYKDEIPCETLHFFPVQRLDISLLTHRFNW